MPAAETASRNSFFDQFIRDAHLTFRKKCRELVIKIYGHEALIAESDTGDIAHCIVFDLDIYRMRSVKWEHLAPRKLLNPFKLLEFLITVPLELLSWFFHRGQARCFQLLVRRKNEWATEKNKLLAKEKTLCEKAGGISVSEATALAEEKAVLERKIKRETRFYTFIATCLALIYPLVSLAVNLATGLVRRVLAPVRYLIRPAIKTARTYPKSFAALVLITLGVTMALAASIFTGGLPAILGAIVLGGSMALKLLTVAGIGVSLGAFLTKGFNAVRELISGIFTAKNAPAPRTQMYGVDKRNQKTDYDINVVKLNGEVTKEHLDRNYQNVLPLLIFYKRKLAIYGRTPAGGTRLTSLARCGYFNALLSEDSKEGRVQVKKPAEIKWEWTDDINEIYEDINIANGHYPRKTGLTDKITQDLHAMDVEHIDLKRPQDQTFGYTAALFFGMESFFYPKRSSVKGVSVPEEKCSKKTTLSL